VTRCERGLRSHPCAASLQPSLAQGPAGNVRRAFPSCCAIFIRHTRTRRARHLHLVFLGFGCPCTASAQRILSHTTYYVLHTDILLDTTYYTPPPPLPLPYTHKELRFLTGPKSQPKGQSPSHSNSHSHLQLTCGAYANSITYYLRCYVCYVLLQTC
jgi:hypothetical protein